MYLSSLSVQKQEFRNDRVAVTVSLLAAVSLFVRTPTRAAIGAARAAESLATRREGAPAKVDVAVVTPVQGGPLNPGGVWVSWGSRGVGCPKLSGRTGFL